MSREPAAPPVCPPPTRPQRAGVGALARLLPAGFRERQAAEWTADLLDLPPGGTRWAYLAGAATTVPALRAAVARGLAAGGPPAAPAAAWPVQLAARVLTVGLGVPVVSWLLWVALRYLALDVPARVAAHGAADPQGLWPMAGTPAVLLPLWAVLHLASWLVQFGGVVLAAWLGAVTAVLGVTHRRAPARRRAVTGFAGVAATVAALLAGPLVGRTDLLLGADLDRGYAVGLTGLAALALGARGRGLSRRRRTVLTAVGLAAAGVAVWLHTPTGRAMAVWFAD